MTALCGAFLQTCLLKKSIEVSEKRASLIGGGEKARWSVAETGWLEITALVRAAVLQSCASPDTQAPKSINICPPANVAGSVVRPVINPLRSSHTSSEEFVAVIQLQCCAILQGIASQLVAILLDIAEPSSVTQCYGTLLPMYGLTLHLHQPATGRPRCPTGPVLIYI